ncbi:MAG: hypothetical protein MRY74_07340 [Neomegalonema sp.]|nr:hypothetical protein [Neomegalonema sp.]
MRTVICALTIMALSAAAAMAEDRPDITSESVLEIKVGMTLAQARKKTHGLKWTYEPRFMVDFSADCASKGGEIILCVLVYEEPKRKADMKIQGIVVMSDKLSARDGVRIGMPLSEAAKRWGAVELSFNHADEAREYVAFAKGPKRISIRARRADAERFAGGHVGVYPEDKAGEEFQKTTRHHPGAVIDSIWLF